jgi:hypothetical protein
MAVKTGLLVRFALAAGVVTHLLSIGCSAEKKGIGVNGQTFGANGGSGAEVAVGSGGSDTNSSSSTPVRSGQAGSGATTKNNTGTGGNCVDVNVQMSRQTPVVMFVVDRSGTTSLPYGDVDPDAGNFVTRWQVLHNAIMDPVSGVIAKTQKDLYLGITLYDGGDLGGGGPNGMPFWMCYIPGMCDPDASTSVPGTGSCPRLITVPPAKNNFDAIAAKYNETEAGPGGMTPTALALAEAYKQIEEQTKAGLDKKSHLTPVVVLVTDGEPNGCDNPFVADYQGPINQVTAASQKGIKTFVIGIDTAIAGSAPEVQSNLDNLAKLGNTGINVAYTPTSQQDLSNTLVSYIGKASCEVVLNGKIAPGYEQRGTVLLNSSTLGYDDKNGYKVTAEDKILLQGSACDKFLNDLTAIFHADFPCEGITLK